MKKFILNIVLVLLIPALFLSGISIWSATKLQRISFKLAESKHIIAMGPSLTECAINDFVLPGWKNLSRGAMGLTTLQLLPNIINDNPQIDTVIICYGRYFFLTRRDIETTNNTAEIRGQLPYSLLGGPTTPYKVFFSNPNLYKVLLSPSVHSLIFERTMIDYGFGYTAIDYSYLHDKNKIRSIDWYDRNCIQTAQGTEQSYIAPSNQAITEAVNYCQKLNIIPILLFPPLYQYDRWITRKESLKYLEELDDDILVADYEDFEFPNDSYYADVHHLNYRGANYFSNHIAKKGIDYIPLKEWRKKIKKDTHSE